MATVERVRHKKVKKEKKSRETSGEKVGRVQEVALDDDTIRISCVSEEVGTSSSIEAEVINPLKDETERNPKNALNVEATVPDKSEKTYSLGNVDEIKSERNVCKEEDTIEASVELSVPSTSITSTNVTKLNLSSQQREEKKVVEDSVKSATSHVLVSESALEEPSVIPRHKDEPKSACKEVVACVEIAPSAPSAEVSNIKEVEERIRNLDEASLHSLYPLRTHHIQLPSESAIHNHPLYVLLSDYLRSCRHLEHSLKKHESLVAKAETYREMVWTVTEENIVESGKCKDQVLVKATYNREIAVKDESHLCQFGRCLSAAREVLHSECAVHLFDSEAHHLRVEHFVQSEEEAQAVMSSHEDLYVCIVILFSFAQRQELSAEFLSKIHLWLLRLGKVLLKEAKPNNQLLLLSLLLRCPRGVSDWGTSLIKFDPPPQKLMSVQSVGECCLELELVVEALSLIINSPALMPHLSHPKKVPSTEAWVVLDSDGEEEVMDVPSDEDLETFLEHIPLKAAVLHSLGLTEEDCPSSVSGVDVLRCFALSNYVLKILGSGLLRPEIQRYPCFCKKLTRLVQHLIHIAVDFWELSCLFNHFHHDFAMQARLSVEFDALLVRAVGYLFSSSNRTCGWENLAELPFKYLSPDARWHILALLHGSKEVKCFEDITVPSNGVEGWMTIIRESSGSFDSFMMSSSDQDASLLLTTITNIANSCGESTFAEVVAYDIFRLGYLSNQVLEEEFLETINHLLVSLFARHSCLFSTTINWLKEVPPESEKGVVALFSDLPLKLWQPSELDLNSLSAWISQNDPQTFKSTVARVILLGMPWRNDGKGHPLPPDISYAAATLALEACLAWDTKGKISSVMWYESPISSWAWSLVGQLSVHSYDRQVTAHSQPFLHSDREESLHAVISRGLRENCPLASFLAVLTTSLGRNYADAEKHAFSHLSLLAAHGKYCAAISALYLILPLFIDHIDDLVGSKNFEKLLVSLVYGDRTYMKMAKNLIISEFPGPIMTQFGNMMVSHLEHPFRFNATMSSFVNLWLRCIFLVPNWMHEKETLYLADLVIRSSFMDESQQNLPEVIIILKRYKEQNCPPIEKSRGAFSALMSLLSREPPPGSPHPQSLVVRNSWPEFPWYVLAALDMEEECEGALWLCIQSELNAALTSSSGSPSLNIALKTACQKLDIQLFPVSCLCIYRWIRQALDTPQNHPVLPLIWARFFSLYSKAFGTCRDNGLRVIFEGSSARISLLSQMKKSVNKSAEWFAKESSADGLDQESSEWLKHCTRLFRAFGLWLEFEQHKFPSSSLPIQYTPERLTNELLHTRKKDWEKLYVNTVQVKKDIFHAVQTWENYRGDDNEAIVSKDSRQDSAYSHPLQRILNRLKSCPVVSPSPFPSHTPSVSSKHMQILGGKEMSSKAIKSCIVPLLECARLYSLYNSEHVALDCLLIELLPSLYRDVITKFNRTVCCNPGLDENGRPIRCSSPATIHFKIKESRICEDVRARIDSNLIDRERLVTSVLHLLPQEACAAGIVLEKMVRELVLEKKNAFQQDRVQETSFLLLNFLIELFNEDAILYYLPAKKLLTICIETLGQEFVVGEEHQLLPLLSQMIKNPNLVGFLAPLVTLTDMSTEMLLKAYGTLVRHVPNMDGNVAFVLFSKFEIAHWLKKDNPSTIERLKLLQLVIDGLSSCNNGGNESSVVSGLLQRHLKALLLYNFPELFRELVEMLLKASGEHCLQPYIWQDVLENIISLGNDRHDSKLCLSLLNAEVPSKQLFELLKQFATGQRVIPLKKVVDLTHFMADFFRCERLRFGLHGLYPKYRLHIKSLQILLELLGHTIVAASNSREMENLTPSDSATLLGHTWLALKNMYAPWLLPYWEDQLKEEGAFWILELMNGHPPLTPWISSDGQYAHIMAMSFERCVEFLIDTFTGHQNALNPVWEMYYSSLAPVGVGCHVLDIMHEALSMLQWNQFRPTIQNLKEMIRVMETSPLECHPFLAAITPRIPWKEWTDSVAPSPILSAEALSSFLKFLLLLSTDNVISKEDTSELNSLLVSASNYSWQNLISSDYSEILKSFVKRINPIMVLSRNMVNADGIEVLALKLLQSVASQRDAAHQGLPPRSVPYYHTVTQLLVDICGLQYAKSVDSGVVKAALVDLVEELEGAVTKAFPNKVYEEQVGIMADVIRKVFIPVFPTASSKFIEALSLALTPPTLQSPGSEQNVIFAKALLYALDPSTLPHGQMYLLVESSLEAALLDKRGARSLLEYLPKLFYIQSDSKEVVGDTLSSCGHLLSLTAYISASPLLFCGIYPLPDIQKDSSDTLNLLIHRWLPAITLQETSEPKIPLLWARALALAQEQQQRVEKKDNALQILYILASALSNLGESQEGMVRGILGAIGIRKKPSASNRFKVICLAVSALLYAYIGKEEYLSRSKDALNGVEKLCRRHKEFNEIGIIATTIVLKEGLTLKDGIELIEILLRRLYPEKPGYLQCIY